MAQCPISLCLFKYKSFPKDLLHTKDKDPQNYDWNTLQQSVRHISWYKSPAVMYFFQAGALFSIEYTKLWPVLAILSRIYANFWFGAPFTGLNIAVVPQNWQISSMVSDGHQFWIPCHNLHLVIIKASKTIHSKNSRVRGLRRKTCKKSCGEKSVWKLLKLEVHSNFSRAYSTSIKRIPNISNILLHYNHVLSIMLFRHAS